MIYDDSTRRPLHRVTSPEQPVTGRHRYAYDQDGVPVAPVARHLRLVPPAHRRPGRLARIVRSVLR